MQALKHKSLDPSLDSTVRIPDTSPPLCSHHPVQNRQYNCHASKYLIAYNYIDIGTAICIVSIRYS